MSRKLIDFQAASAGKRAKNIMVSDVMPPVIGESAAAMLVILDIVSLADVMKRPKTYFDNFHGFGPKKINAMEEVLKQHGLEFATRDDSYDHGKAVQDAIDEINLELSRQIAEQDTKPKGFELVPKK